MNDGRGQKNSNRSTSCAESLQRKNAGTRVQADARCSTCMRTSFLGVVGCNPTNERQRTQRVESMTHPTSGIEALGGISETLDADSTMTLPDHSTRRDIQRREKRRGAVASLAGREAVHTFWMRFAIDVAFVDSSGIVKRVVEGLRIPRRVSQERRAASRRSRLPDGRARPPSALGSIA